MNKSIKILACLCIFGFAAACDSGSDTPTCDGLSKHVVELMKPQGADAMIKEADIPKLTAACQKGEVLGKYKSDVECAMKAKDLKGLEACPNINQMLKGAMKGAN